MNIENEIKKLKRDNLRMNIILVIALGLMGFIGGIDKVVVTRLTKATSEISQKVGVEFQTKTNNLFGVWQIVNPK